MNTIVSKIYDKQRFAWFVHLKYGYPLSYTKTLAEWIDGENKYLFSKLTEAEVRYLQASICKLKIINLSRMPQVRRAVKQKPSYIDMSPQYGDESKRETLDLFHVKFTKVIHFDEMLNERQIQALLKDKNVKSINIDK